MFDVLFIIISIIVLTASIISIIKLITDNIKECERLKNKYGFNHKRT